MFARHRGVALQTVHVLYESQVSPAPLNTNGEYLYNTSYNGSLEFCRFFVEFQREKADDLQSKPEEGLVHLRGLEKVFDNLGHKTA
jgi:hypothetical protein